MAVLNKHKDHIPSDAIYIGRGSKFGNPFPITKTSSRNEVVGKYKRYVKDQIRMGHISLRDLSALYNRDLVCYCAPAACHGDVLEKLSVWAYNKLNPMASE